MKRASPADGILKGNTLTIIPVGGESIPDSFRRLEKALKDSETALAKLIIFGSVDACPAGEQSMRRVLGKISWPVTWIQGSACDRRPIAGIQGFAFPLAQVEAVTLEGRAVGSVVREPTLRHCLLGGTPKVAPLPGRINLGKRRRSWRRLWDKLASPWRTSRAPGIILTTFYRGMERSMK